MFVVPRSPCYLKWKTICTGKLLGGERPFHNCSKHVVGVEDGQFTVDKHDRYCHCLPLTSSGTNSFKHY